MELERIDPEGALGWREMLDAAVLNIEELARAVRDYEGRVDLDPARLVVYRVSMGAVMRV